MPSTRYGAKPTTYYCATLVDYPEAASADDGAKVTVWPVEAFEDPGGGVDILLSRPLAALQYPTSPH